jgi:outer membrane protein assembly factor BamB
MLKSDTGQLLASAPVRTNDSSGSRRPPYFASASTLGGQVNGHLLVVNLGTDIAALDGLRPDRTSEALLWRLDATDDGGVGQRGSFPSTRANPNPLVGNRPILYDAAGKLSFDTGPILGSGISFQRGRQLVCVDPLTGQALWERSSSPQAEIPQQAELFGDGELLFVADARLDPKSEDEALVLSALDGSLLGKRTISPAERRWATHGRNVLAWESKNNTITLRLTDAWQGRELWSRQVSQKSRGSIIDGEELAVLEPSGQFTIVSLQTGKVRFTSPLQAEPTLGWIQVIRSHDQYLLLASQDDGPVAANELMPLSMMPQRNMHGRVYAIARSTGKLAWQTPAFVSRHCLPPDQPSESPLLLFIGNRQANNRMTTSVLAIDRRTGGKIYEKEHPGNMTAMSDVAADLARQTVSLALIGQNRTITFQFTDKPQPPQPPAQTGDMASNSAGRPRGVVDPSISAALELLRGGIDPRALIPAPARPAAPPVPRP